MRIGTWNLNNKWNDKHRDVLMGHRCDVWLLTEIHPKAVKPKDKIADFHCRLSKGVMARNQHWAAVLSNQELSPLPDPHPASAAAKIDGITYCATVLPWAGCKKYPPIPWIGETLREMTKEAIESLLKALPRSDLVWGGDWNQNLEGGWEYVGTIDGQSFLKSAMKRLNLQVPTKGLSHRNNISHTIDHVAVPSEWRVKRKPERVVATGLSDHDAYVIEV